MNLQTIKSVDGRDEYILLPIDAYRVLKKQIDKVISGEYEKFDINDFVENPIALMRIKAQLTQEEIADYMKVSQAYISKIENQTRVSPKIVEKLQKILKSKKYLG